jgi:hypothetical protein
MKKTMQPVFEASWWNANQPKGLASGRDVRDALAAYEKARDALRKSGAAGDLEKASDALDRVGPAVDGAITEAGKLRKANAKGTEPLDLEATADVLKRFARKYDGERADLEKLVKAGNDEEDDANAFSDPLSYRKYLLGALRRLDAGEPMNFGLVLGHGGGDHRMAISRTKGPNGLARAVMAATGLRTATFGTAAASPDRPGAIVLALEGRQLPGLKKKGDQMLKAFRPLPFEHFMLTVNGAEVEDIPDPDDTGAAADTGAEPGAGAPAAGSIGTADLVAAMRQAVPAMQRAITASPARREEIMAPATAFQAEIKRGDTAAARKSLTALLRLLGTLSPAGNPAPVPYAALIETWMAARTRAANDLRKLESAILDRFRDDPSFASVSQGVRKLDTVLAALGSELQDRLGAAMSAASEASRGPAQAGALAEAVRCRGFVNSDPLVAALDSNPFAPVAIKSALSAALNEIEKALAA